MMNTRYYYRNVNINGKRKRTYVGKASDPAVRIVMRNDRLRAAEEKLAAEKRKTQQTRCRQIKSFWVHLLQIVRSWQVLELGCIAAKPAAPTSLTSPYPWQGDPLDRYHQIRRLMSEHVITAEQVQRVIQAGRENKLTAVRELAGIIAYERKVFAGAVDLLSICRDQLVESIAADCPITRAAIEASIVQLNVDNGYAAASAMERLLIEAISITYFESMAFGALSFEEDHGPTHARALSDTANQATRRFVDLFQILNAYRKHHEHVSAAESRTDTPVAPAMESAMES